MISGLRGAAPGTPCWCHFGTVADFLAVCFYMFFDSLILNIFTFVVNGWVHLGSVWLLFWSAWEPWQSSQNLDGSTILTLWTSFFQARFLGLNLLPTFSRLSALWGIFSFWDFFGRLLDAFGMPFRARDTHGSLFCEFMIKIWFLMISGLRDAPPRDFILMSFWYLCRLLGSLFLHVLLIPKFSDFLLHNNVR